MDGVTAPSQPPLPGGIGVTHLRVYDTAAVDGLRGGTPHIHTVCTEAYAVVGGSGEVHTLTATGFEVTPLEPRKLVWFTPGTIHRLVNHGELEILVLMGNAGLPEAGDMVITFPPEIVGDATAYAEAAALPDDDRTTAGPGVAARTRRDLAVPRFLELVEATVAGDALPLAGFHAQAGALVRPRVDEWRDTWGRGPRAAAERTATQLTALADGVVDYLAAASVHADGPPPDERLLGCCGTLGKYALS
jgi:mannose-6-phosphate isomerase-like protein (cupin superfamily)